MKAMPGLLPTDRAAPPQKSPLRSMTNEYGFGKSPVKTSQNQSSIPQSYEQQLELYMQEKVALEGKITKLQTYLKQWQQECETKDKKHFKLEGALNEVIYYVEECAVLKQSIKELRMLFNKNENQLKQFLDLRKDPKLTLNERPELEMKIRNLAEENKKNKEIEDGLVNNLRINDQELSMLKNMILKTFEDQLALILCSEVKELQLKKENIVQKIEKIHLAQELASKMTFLGEYEKTCKKLLEELELEKQEKNDLQQKVNKLQRSKNFKSGEMKAEPEKPALYKKPIQYFSTPKTNSKLYNTNVKTVDSKGQQSNPIANNNANANPNPSFRTLGKDYSKSPKPKAGSFVQTLTSPVTVTKGPRFSNKDVWNSKESMKQKSPINAGGAGGFLGVPVTEFKKSLSIKKSDDNLASLGSPLKAARTRYSDVNEFAARNKPTTIAQIKLADLKTQRSEETATSKSGGKTQSMNLAEVNHFLSTDGDLPTVSSVEANEGTQERDVFAMLNSKDVSKVNPILVMTRQSSNHQNGSGPIRVTENLMAEEQFDFASKGQNTSIRVGGSSNESQLASIVLLSVKNSIALARSIDNGWNVLRNSKDSLKSNPMNLENVDPSSSSKKSDGERSRMNLMRESDSCVNYKCSTNKKKTPQKNFLRDITNTFSSQKKGGLSSQSSLVQYESSVKKKPVLNSGHYQKYLTSGKNPMSESGELRASQFDSPTPEGGIIRNLRNFA